MECNCEKEWLEEEGNFSKGLKSQEYMPVYILHDIYLEDGDMSSIKLVN
jgi:hypothetical protein